MWGQPGPFQGKTLSTLLTVTDWRPIWYSAHRRVRASLMRHRPTEAYWSPAGSLRLRLTRSTENGGLKAAEMEARATGRNSWPLISPTLRAHANAYCEITPEKIHIDIPEANEVFFSMGKSKYNTLCSSAYELCDYISGVCVISVVAAGNTLLLSTLYLLYFYYVTQWENPLTKGSLWDLCDYVGQWGKPLKKKI